MRLGAGAVALAAVVIIAGGVSAQAPSLRRPAIRRLPPVTSVQPRVTAATDVFGYPSEPPPITSESNGPTLASPAGPTRVDRSAIQTESDSGREPLANANNNVPQGRPQVQLAPEETGYVGEHGYDGAVGPVNHLPDTGVRANNDGDAEHWLGNYRSRIDSSVEPPLVDPQLVAELPTSFVPWWDAQVKGVSSAPALRVAIDQLVAGALRYSSFIQVASTQPEIRKTRIVEEAAEFDWRAFVEANYDNISEPVGNALVTGNNETRFRDRTWIVDGGLRRRNTLGGELELRQDLGGQRNNSTFLIPNPQSTTQFELQYTQPLLNGAGKAYNESRVVLAEIDANVSQDELVGELQEHLVKVTEAYWELYGARAEYYQRLKLLDAARTTLALLEGRQHVDAVPRQVLRAKAAVATRQSEIIRARNSIRNAESRLRLLVNDPALLQAQHRFAPVDSPLLYDLPVTLGDSLHTALVNRPDISRAVREVRGSGVRLGVAKNELLPKLDLIVGTYVAGLAPGSRLARSFGDQFGEGRPSYSVGFQFEVPLGNRAARIREQRRQWQMARAMAEFRLTVEEALTDVELSVRELKTSYGEMASKYQAMVAAEKEAAYLSHRWKAIPGVDDSATLLLENLLDAQERLADEEAAMVRAQVSYAMAVVQLKSEMGTLLRMGMLNH